MKHTRVEKQEIIDKTGTVTGYRWVEWTREVDPFVAVWNDIYNFPGGLDQKRRILEDSRLVPYYDLNDGLIRVCVNPAMIPNTISFPKPPMIYEIKTREYDTDLSGKKVGIEKEFYFFDELPMCCYGKYELCNYFLEKYCVDNTKSWSGKNRLIKVKSSFLKREISYDNKGNIIVDKTYKIQEKETNDEIPWLGKKCNLVPYLTTVYRYNAEGKRHGLCKYEYSPCDNVVCGYCVALYDNGDVVGLIRVSGDGYVRYKYQDGKKLYAIRNVKWHNKDAVIFESSEVAPGVLMVCRYHKFDSYKSKVLVAKYIKMYNLYNKFMDVYCLYKQECKNPYTYTVYISSKKNERHLRDILWNQFSNFYNSEIFRKSLETRHPICYIQQQCGLGDKGMMLARYTAKNGIELDESENQTLNNWFNLAIDVNKKMSKKPSLLRLLKERLRREK